MFHTLKAHRVLSACQRSLLPCLVPTIAVRTNVSSWYAPAVGGMPLLPAQCVVSLPAPSTGSSPHLPPRRRSRLRAEGPGSRGMYSSAWLGRRRRWHVWRIGAFWAANTGIPEERADMRLAAGPVLQTNDVRGTRSPEAARRRLRQSGGGRREGHAA